MPTTAPQQVATCLSLTRAISRSRSVQEIYGAALDALNSGLGVDRASILLFDPDGVLRFKAFRGLSESFRRAVEGHARWPPDSPDPQPVWVSDVAKDPSLETYLPTLAREGIAALACIPLISLERVIGMLVLYYAAPTAASHDDLQLAGVITAQVAFAVERTRTEEQARRSEERLRYALDAASMGTWEWDLATSTVQWSDNLAGIHGLPPGTFDGTFASYEREIHPDDRERVLASIRRAVAEGIPHDVEYRLVAPDGTVRWCEGKGRVEYEQDQPARMSGVCMMVTRRKEAELARLAAAEESSRLKDEFLATLSHELRTPLNAILGWVQILRNGQLPPARARQALEVIGRNARLQAQLIEDILDVSRIISGKLEVERGLVLLPQLIETVVAGIAPAAEAKRIALEQRVSGELPSIEGDAKRLHQVLNNVLSNAVKFTPDGGSIVLTCEADGRWVSLRIEDSGAGIAPEFLPYVFDRFRQGDSRSTRAHGGLGLGLAIAQHLIEQHQGEIRAESGGIGRGTTIFLRLPVAATGDRDVCNDLTPAGVDARLDTLDLLVVDDQRDSREMLAALLEQRGAAVAQCDSADCASTYLAARPVHLVIADIAMPRVDGYEFIRRLRAGGNRTPAIAVTAFARSDDRRRALDAGYAAYLCKPIDVRQLARTVRDLVMDSMIA